MDCSALSHPVASCPVLLELKANSSPATVFLTGMGGYPGSVLVPRLLREGHCLRALDRFFFGKERLSQHANLEITERDCRNYSPELMPDVSAVIDLVAISNDPARDLFNDTAFEINMKSNKIADPDLK